MEIMCTFKPISNKEHWMFSKKYKAKNGHYLKTYLDYLRRSNRSPNTLLAYERDLILFLNWWHGKKTRPLEKVRAHHIDEFFEYLGRNENGLHKRRAVSSKRRLLSSLKNFFSFLLEKFPKGPWWFSSGFSESPVKSKLHHIRLKDSDVQHTPLMKEAEWEALWNTPLREKERLMLALMYWAGLRLSECRKLKSDQLNTQTNVLWLFRKGGKRHEFFLQDNGQIGLLWEHLSLNQRSPYLFTWGHSPLPMTRRGAFKLVKKCFKKANLPHNLSPHSLRKACATRLYQETKDLLFVRDYLGHSDAKVTQSYIDVQGKSRLIKEEDEELLPRQMIRDSFSQVGVNYTHH